MEEYDKLIVRAILEVEDMTIAEASEIVQDGNYMFYNVETFDEFIDILIDEGVFGDIPNNLINYLDYDAIARDLQFDGYTMTSVGIINLY